MVKNKVDSMREFYSRESDIMANGDMGEGLWPLDFELGQVMYNLIIENGCVNGIEIGSGVGYATVWAGLALKKLGGRLVTFEYFPPKVDLLHKHLNEFGLDSVVEIVPEDFMRGIDDIQDGIDFVFLDARKCDYLAHLNILMPKMQEGAVVCADNVTSHAESLEEYLHFVRCSGHFGSELIDIGAGMEISRFAPL